MNINKCGHCTSQPTNKQHQRARIYCLRMNTSINAQCLGKIRYSTASSGSWQYKRNSRMEILRLQISQKVKICLNLPEIACTRRCVSSAGTRRQQGHGVINDSINTFLNCP